MGQPGTTCVCKRVGALKGASTKTRQILSDQRVLRGCILLQHLQGKESMEGFQLLSDSLGQGFMEYNHFNYWFEGLANGTLSLDSIDRFEASLMEQGIDLPNNSQEVIPENVLQTDRLPTSEDDKTCIKNFIHLSFEENDKVELAFANQNCTYRKHNDNDCRVKHYNSEEGKEDIIENSSPLEVAMNTLSSHLQGRELALDAFKVSIAGGQEKSFEALQSILQLNGSMSAKYMSISGFITADQTAKVLKNFKPGALEKILIEISVSPDASIQNIVCMDQWTQATTLICGAHILSTFVKHLTYFKLMDVNFCKTSLSKKDIMQFQKNVLAKSEKLEYCTFDEVRYNRSQFMIAFNGPKSETSSDSFTYHANNSSFNIYYQKHGIQFKKN